jgi:hypothetical protein
MTRGKKGPETCTVKDCQRKHFANGMCNHHHRKNRIEFPTSSCSVESCEKGAFLKGYCQMHYTRDYRHGDPLIKHSPINQNHGKHLRPPRNDKLYNFQQDLRNIVKDNFNENLWNKDIYD